MSADPLIGTELGGYRIVEKIGRGGMSDVYKGHDPKNDRYVAIKLIGQHLPADRDLTVRFRREAQAAASLNHPHIISVYDFGEYGGGHYMVMEYVEGTNLQRRIQWRYSRNRDFKPHEIVELIDQIASALDAAHTNGIVHRDIKPANILLAKKRGAVLSDFGLVMLRDRVSQQTRGESFGTPEYIAPEQAIDSRTASARSDVYSLGVLLYELTTGRLPFDSDSALSLALMHIGEEPTPPRQHAPKMSSQVESVILRAMAKEPERRYGSAGELASALREAYGDKAIPPAKRKESDPQAGRIFSRRRVLVPAGIVLLLLLLGFVGFWLVQDGNGLLPGGPTASNKETGTPEQGPAAVVDVTVTVTTDESPEPTASAPSDSSANVSPEPTASSSPEATPSSLPEPTPGSSPEPTSSPSSEPTASPSLEPTSTASPQPTASATSQPTATELPVSDGPSLRSAVRSVDRMPLRFVPSGEFLMGSSGDDPAARPHEQPQHWVFLSAFWMDQTEVTNEQYRLCVETGACEAPVLSSFFDDPDYADHPVVYVRWEQAASYCNWLAEETGWPVALPTEAQWEKAAAWDPESERHQLYPWGDEAPTAELANINVSGIGGTAPVGSYPEGASYYSVMDLAGNVWEWVADWYDQDYYDTPDLPPDPQGPASGSQRVMRGGNYGFGAEEARTSHRTAGSMEASGVGLGFRCIVNAEELPES